MDQQAQLMAAPEMLHPPLVVCGDSELSQAQSACAFRTVGVHGSDALPLTPNGKIDRKALPLPSPQQARSRVEFRGAANID